MVRLASTTPLSLPTLLPSLKGLGDAVQGAVSINTSVRSLPSHIHHNSLHVLELFGGIELGVFRTALAAGYVIRCYTYVDRDNVNWRLARSALDSLQQQYPPSASFVSHGSIRQSAAFIYLFYQPIIFGEPGCQQWASRPPRGSWECQSGSRAGHQLGGAMKPHFTYFYDMAVLGAPVLVDGVNLGAAAHRVRLFLDQHASGCYPSGCPAYTSTPIPLFGFHSTTIPCSLTAKADRSVAFLRFTIRWGGEHV